MTRNIGRAERENIIYILANMVMLETTTNAFKEHVGKKSTARRLDLAYMHLDKAVHEWMGTLSIQSQIRIANEAERYVGGVIPHKDAQKHTLKMLKWENETRRQALEDLGEGLEPIYTLTELFLANICKRCNGHPNGKPSNECPAFIELDKLQVPGWNEHPECQYASAGVVE